MTFLPDKLEKGDRLRSKKGLLFIVAQVTRHNGSILDDAEKTTYQLKNKDGYKSKTEWTRDQLQEAGVTMYDE